MSQLGESRSWLEGLGFAVNDEALWLEALTHDFTLPDGACRSWQALYAAARKLADDLVEHIHTENNMLFPRFEHRDAG